METCVHLDSHSTLVQCVVPLDRLVFGRCTLTLGPKPSQRTLTSSSTYYKRRGTSQK